jgi:hypothetical protein
MNKKLELLSLAYNFSITKNEQLREYKIECINANLGATIDENNKITYYVTVCYDSGHEWIDFDEKEFEKLKQFCELMIEKEVL